MNHDHGYAKRFCQDVENGQSMHSMDTSESQIEVDQVLPMPDTLTISGGTNTGVKSTCSGHVNTIKQQQLKIRQLQRKVNVQHQILALL